MKSDNVPAAFGGDGDVYELRYDEGSTMVSGVVVLFLKHRGEQARVRDLSVRSWARACTTSTGRHRE
jgi:hypothetical protein